MINIQPVRGQKDRLILIDQTRLPEKENWVTLKKLDDIAQAIKKLMVRGAPAIGIAAAYGLRVHIHKAKTPEKLQSLFDEAYKTLAATRPTAVNLFWALNRMKEKYEKLLAEGKSVEQIKDALFQEAEKIEEEDYGMGREIGEHGFSLMKDMKEPVKAMTICNAGGLATAGYGTALACFYMAKEKGKDIQVYAMETRPLMQGSRLTTHELMKAGIHTTLLTDNMAGFFMKKEKVDIIITGADRIASNGDSANKIGTYQLAVLAKHHNIPFYIAAPGSTFDFELKTGDEIPIEFREKEEMTHFRGVQSAPVNVEVFSPAFDVTPASLISGIITNKGVFTAPYHFTPDLFY
jgi:methylthioribose-1-phosphate isomerase